MVGHDDEALFPWLERPLREALNLHAANALLLHGPQGNGQFQLALAIARAFLCESKRETSRLPPACGRCASCRLFASRTHPDLMFLVPESLREALGWPQSTHADDSGAAGASGRSKPSKEIRVDDVRAVVAFVQSSSARGLGKAVIIHPAERMNVIAANALLKALEEPAGQTRYVLSSNAVDTLLPTVRSRCLAVPIALPSEASAVAWLEAKGVREPQDMLAATGGRPFEALQWFETGIDASLWISLPGRVAQGRAETFVDWPMSRLIETLQKLCHDSLCIAVGAAPRYFPRQRLVGSGDVAKLLEWSAALREHVRHAEHPWQASLKIDSLVEQARCAVAGSLAHEIESKRGPRGRPSVHSST